ncbi:uncharacterized protein K444DRAFT_630412 [Hyaloscypha bicolor E]|uniref:DUF6594 domain-containing protein n=1 Tax=Hyaloscypha bicolor E TaxID=1095630 RepID=A0A2J6T6Z8_9HELO|nr:uncharacterized protein K444DRAFT_630412 [Hyaloscypha bicolor E]PMD58723.1 hypothetical protein K444DRAFT_630412 [Hyaloscypha bicolor E]
MGKEQLPKDEIREVEGDKNVQASSSVEQPEKLECINATRKKTQEKTDDLPERPEMAQKNEHEVKKIEQAGTAQKVGQDDLAPSTKDLREETERLFKRAELMAIYQEDAIFRQFKTLNMLILSELEEELIRLEQELRNPESNEQRAKKILKTKETMKEYYETLLRAKDVARLGRLSFSDLQFLNALEEDFKQAFHPLEKIDVFRTKDRSDLVILTEQREETPLEKSLSKLVSPLARLVTAPDFLKKKASKQIDLELGFGSMRRFSRADLLIKMLRNMAILALSAILPLGSILALYFVKNTLNRIGVMVGFTITFAAALMISTSAKMIEVIAATAA